ncbi:uncharacterized protein LOC112340489 [Selaginella moellendorffii]|uniref:uncharacterized protein LOC112340489 n=1 Tax=Selaginella moellendorffii TaxID=88036 RepID=UPI000D1CE738|nr:uncharacterized protein LOC112340489 [Selaginella moellendorffii]|eukprot:XP_024521216.1 uncharacterized protein LOC112340489 [Selaginella moellendorffii]
MMRAMVFEAPGSALKLTELQIPESRDGQVRVKVSACAVCRTDLHVIGRGVDSLLFSIGARVGIPWPGRTCGSCSYCVDGAENLCDEPGFTVPTASPFRRITRT